MNLRHLTARTAVAGVTTALAAGALVGLGAQAADAATATNTYTCSLGALYSGEFALTVDGSLPVPQFWAGAPVPKDLLKVTASVTVPADAAGLLAGLGYTCAKSDDFTLALGKNTVPEPLAGTFKTEGGTTTWNATGSNKAFMTPGPGTATALLPAKFSFTTTGGTGQPVTLACVLKDAPAKTLASIQLLRQQSALVVKAPKKVKKGKLAAIAVTATSVSYGATVPDGTVVVKEGRKVLGKGKLNKVGKVTVKLGKKLKVGKHKLTVTYTGTPSIKGKTVKTVLKVVKK